YGNLTIGGRAVPAVGLDQLQGQVFPTLLEGRAASAPDEIVLGTTTMRRAHTSVGRKLAVQFEDVTRQLTVVGRAVFPPLGRGGLLAVLAVFTLGHSLVSSVRRRRRDLAVLKTLGFVRSQVSASVAWQATTFAGIAVLFGLPLGLVAGRWAWSTFARGLGVDPTVATPLLAVALTVPFALIAANFMAAIPARTAGATRPATALRSE